MDAKKVESRLVNGFKLPPASNPHDLAVTGL
jgi:hypothetical protein